MMRKTILEKAIHVAIDFHCDQVDKGGQPYILHPMRVMLHYSLISDDERVIAIFHDALEDTDLTMELVLTYIPELAAWDETLSALVAITRNPKETYFTYINRVAHDPLARKVKILDLQDNLDIVRVDDIGKSLRARYEKALRILQEAA